MQIIHCRWRECSYLGYEKNCAHPYGFAGAGSVRREAVSVLYRPGVLGALAECRLFRRANHCQAGYGGKHHPREERDYRLDSPAGNLQGGGGVPARKGDWDVSLAAGVCGDGGGL